jgi:hypothetical protein
LGWPKTALTTILWFNLMILFEAVHPLEGGAFHLKFRRDRRFGMKIESRFVAAAIVVKAWHYLSVYRSSMRMLKEVLKAPDRWSYTDLATAPPRDDELGTLDLYHVTSGGEGRWPARAATMLLAPGTPRPPTGNRFSLPVGADRCCRAAIPDAQRVLEFDPAILLDAEAEVVGRTARGEVATFPDPARKSGRCCGRSTRSLASSRRRSRC